LIIRKYSQIFLESPIKISSYRFISEWNFLFCVHRLNYLWSFKDYYSNFHFSHFPSSFVFFFISIIQQINELNIQNQNQMKIMEPCRRWWSYSLEPCTMIAFIFNIIGGTSKEYFGQKDNLKWWDKETIFLTWLGQINSEHTSSLTKKFILEVIAAYMNMARISKDSKKDVFCPIMFFVCIMVPLLQRSRESLVGLPMDSSNVQYSML
jgi:hypothetical protein